MKKRLSTFLLTVAVFAGQAQTKDEAAIKQIFDEALGKGKSYEMLYDLSVNIGARLSGSPGAAAAVEWSRHVMEGFDFDSVWLQPVGWFRIGCADKKKWGELFQKRWVQLMLMFALLADQLVPDLRESLLE